MKDVKHICELINITIHINKNKKLTKFKLKINSTYDEKIFSYSLIILSIFKNPFNIA